MTTLIPQITTPNVLLLGKLWNSENEKAKQQEKAQILHV